MIAACVVFLISATVPAADETWIEPRCHKLPFERLGPFVHLSDGKILCLQGNAASVTADAGKTWSEPKPIYDGPQPGIPGNSVAVRTQAGAIVVVFTDTSTYKWGWDNAKRAPAADVNLDVWSIRSLDDARRPSGGLSYPYLFEPAAGELWVFTRFSHPMGLALKETDFVAK